MAKKATTPKAAAPVETSELEAVAAKLDAMSAEVAGLGEEQVAKSIANAAKSARWFDKQRQNRVRRVGGLVASMKAKGLSDSEIVAALTK